MKTKLLIIASGIALVQPALAAAVRNCQFFTAAVASPVLVAASPSALGFDSAKLAVVDQQISSDVRHGFPGAGLVIIKDGKVIKQTLYGYRLKYSPSSAKKLAKPLPLECATLFDLASNTKMYATNYALMHLLFQAKLDLDKPLHYYIPEYQGCDEHGQCREERTVRDLLTHRAGYAPDPQFFNPQSIAQYGNGLYSQDRQTTESIILTRLPFASKRGDKPVYSDIDFMLLGLLIERISGLPLDGYLAANIYQPLGLEQTMFNPLQHSVSLNRCAATEINGNTRGGRISFPNIRTKPILCQVHDEKAYYSMGGVSGHAGLFSNLADMAVLVDLMLTNGSYNGVQLWDKAVQDQFTQPLASDNSYGLGWRLAGTAATRYAPFGSFASSTAFGHTGWTGTLTLIDPKYHLAIILLTNKKHSKFYNDKFAGDSFASGQYHHIIDLIYQALI